MKTDFINFIEIDLLNQDRFTQQKTLSKSVFKIVSNSFLNSHLFIAYAALMPLFLSLKKLEQRSNSKLLLKFALLNSTTHSTKYFK